MARRILARALFLVVPLALVAVAAPRVYTQVTGKRARPERPPDGPTPAQISAAHDAARQLSSAERGWERVEIIAPSSPPKEGAEETAPFQGFGLSLETEPEGASVTVDGRALGETPYLGALRCEPGAKLSISLSRPPFAARELTTLCRADTLVKLRIRLR